MIDREALSAELVARARPELQNLLMQMESVAPEDRGEVATMLASAFLLGIAAWSVEAKAMILGTFGSGGLGAKLAERVASELPTFRFNFVDEEP